MIQRKYNPNICLAIAVAAILIVLILGVLQKQLGIFDGADALAIKTAKSLRSFYPLTFLMSGITLLGDEMGLMIVICAVFWLGYTTEAITFLLMLLFGGIINTWMKEFFELVRPPEQKIRWLADADGYGYPSGHSMVGMLYSWLIYAFVKKYWYLCLIAGLSMAASRIYLGVHYFSDTVGGLLCGFGIVVAATGIYARVSDLTSLRESVRNSRKLKIILSFALSATYLILAWGQSGAFKYAGLLGGFFIVHSMFNLKWRARNVFFAVITVVTGLIVMLAIRIGLSAFFPKNDFSDYCRYFILGVFLASSPLVFLKMRLLKKIEETAQDYQKEPMAE
jgi:membrane-associated phospholipid phosphatase